MVISQEDVDQWLKDLSVNLLKLRAEKGLSQQELADKAGLTRAVYGDMERGDRIPKITTILKVAKALDCAPEKLLPPVPH